MKIKLYEHLTEEEIEDIFRIILNLKQKISNKTITYKESFLEIKNSKEIKMWFSNLKNEEKFYKSFFEPLHKILLDGYKSIFEPLVKKGVIVGANAGTQLGVVRDGQLIEWDDDIDLVMDVKDFNKFKKEIYKNSIKNFWIPWSKNWLNDDLSTKNNKNLLHVQFTSIKKLKLDFGKFVVYYMPIIDLFPCIRVDNNLKLSDKENIITPMIRYYNNFYRVETDQIINNRRFIDNAPRYRESAIKIHNETMDKNSKKESKLDFKKILETYYSPNSDTLLQLHKGSPTYSLFDYNNFTIKNIYHKDNEYKFLISDNYVEQFEKEYGENWKIPKKTHIHFIWLWFTFIKRRYK